MLVSKTPWTYERKHPLMNLDEKKVLQRAPNLRVDIASPTNIRIQVGGQVLVSGSHGLAVLDAFSQPISVSQAMKKLRGRSTGVQDWVDLISTVSGLYQAGVLLDSTAVQPEIASQHIDFASAPIHLAMLNDRSRTSTFLAAVQKVVQPGDVVVDIGTGTGILAIAAARAGAGHVYAIEASSIAESAKALFEASGLADRITLLRGWSTQVILPQPADVLISEILGSEPLEERVLEVTRDALERLMKPKARLVPSKVRIMGRPVTIPRTELTRHTFTEKTLRDWQRWYEIDFTPLSGIARHSVRRFIAHGHAARRWKVLSDPLLLAEIDFRKIKRLSIEKNVSAVAKTAGKLNGLVVYFELELGPHAQLSTDPCGTDNDTHWGNPIWIFPDELSLKAADRLEVSYRYGGMKTDVSCRLRG